MLGRNCSDTNMRWNQEELAQLEMTYLVLIVKVELCVILKISVVLICFLCKGNVVNQPEHGSLDWVKICERSSKVITFIDLAGHERYLKTTVFGMTGHAPDFGMLMVLSFTYNIEIATATFCLL